MRCGLVHFLHSSLLCWVNLIPVTFNITPSQDSSHIGPIPKPFSSSDLWEPQSFACGSLASQEPLLTHSGSTFREMCVLMKETWGDFLSSREEALSGSWTIVGVCVFEDYGDSDWGGPFITLYALYQRVFVSKVNVCRGNEPLVSVRYWLLHLVVVFMGHSMGNPGCSILL